MSLYDLLLDDLMAKSRSKMTRTELDEMIEQCAIVSQQSKPSLLACLHRVFDAYAVPFMQPMVRIHNLSPLSEKDYKRLRKDILSLGIDEAEKRRKREA